MPTAPDNLREKWGGDPVFAIAYLRERHFIIEKGGNIKPTKESFPLVRDDGSAIDYLVQEWDYGFEPYREPEEPS